MDAAALDASTTYTPAPERGIAMPSSDEPFQRVLESFAVGVGVEPGRARNLARAVNVPSPRPDELIPALLSLAARAGADPHACLYLSTPITTGRNQLDLADGAVASPESQRRASVAANRRHAVDVARRLRERTGSTVIEPATMVDVPGWGQPDYHALWVEVLRRFATTTAFVDGWQFSVGCSIEFCESLRLGLPLVTERLEPLAVDEALALLRSAVAETGAATASGAALARSLADAERLALPGRADGRPSERRDA